MIANLSFMISEFFREALLYAHLAPRDVYNATGVCIEDFVPNPDEESKMIRLNQPRADRQFQGWRIPQPDEDPTDEMVEWLQAAPADAWEGDSSGIAVRRGSDGHTWYENGGPGDYIVWDPVLECLRIIRAAMVGPDKEFRLL